jgi:outer membrane protein OmpA-like peptidoglycan-associated protein
MHCFTAMMTSRIAAFLATALLCGAACSSKDKAASTVPAAPEFAEQDKVEDSTPTPASDSDQPIAPEDQVFFALDSDDLEPRARLMLDDVAAWVKSNPEREILVQGHADSSGSKEHNLDLSARRAQAVGAYLKEKGVGDDQLVLAAQGEQGAGLKPVAANRRVVIYATVIESASR